MGRADLQLHSDLGDGLSSLDEILDAAERAALDVIALTDHDDIRGAFALRDLAARRSSPVEVVPGVEVTTRSGHLLALWIEEEIPMLCSLAQAVARVHHAGGVAIVPHPLSYLTFSIGEGALRKLASSGEDTGMVDAIEVRNPSYAGRVRAARASWLNTHVLRVAETGSSDAHHAALVGTCWTDFPGSGAAALRRAIGDRATTADGRRWTLREHLDGAARQQWRALVRDPVKRARRRMTASKSKRK
jgi:predicted metal-dependent phosphoesterase TrpH